MTSSQKRNWTYYNVDAFPVGQGAIFTQDNKLLSYASSALTEAESRYSQTERQALALGRAKYKPGDSNPSDYFSRHQVITDTMPLQEQVAEEHISFIATTSTPKSMTLDELEDATSNDKTL